MPSDQTIRAVAKIHLTAQQRLAVDMDLDEGKPNLAISRIIPILESRRRYEVISVGEEREAIEALVPTS